VFSKEKHRRTRNLQIILDKLKHRSRMEDRFFFLIETFGLYFFFLVIVDQLLTNTFPSKMAYKKILKPLEKLKKRLFKMKTRKWLRNEENSKFTGKWRSRRVSIQCYEAVTVNHNPSVRGGATCPHGRCRHRDQS
jgi:hypothetical protein